MQIVANIYEPLARPVRPAEPSVQPSEQAAWLGQGSASRFYLWWPALGAEISRMVFSSRTVYATAKNPAQVARVG
jgi:hypothetical protein